ncbi:MULTISPECIES: tubulin-like doman-containing protein [unclassified Meiothermus]|uniref:tubulin-like doman-containing protein n=1 Tax=unclassified Meiothermus TaxID=370471 RepID=UPI000D7B95A0|nr:MULTISPECIES: tubulin-like doman-containing protein [unclassified Meiothermus]PZA06058.1 hypothetical protein DNA98_15495 [Meiothermus sp. Pnk-1]RYM36147.1 hypothetical protein EWH23_11055 [Meiothermus sp. PNK-Is4]
MLKESPEKEVRKLKRTVLIGLGGTGKRALLQAKKRFLETFGEEPPLIKFLLIDTTNANTDSLRVETPDGQEVKARLKASEVLHIEARGASLLPQVHDEVRTWFPPKADLKANILSGAGQIRALGRLALFANAATVYENLRDLLALARDYLDERPSEERRYIYETYSPHLTVVLVGSLAGGTGSGIFLDMAFVLRELMKDEDQLFGYFLLPDIYLNRPGTQNVEANAYAALKELDHFMSREDTWSYTFGGHRIQVRKKPFDMLFLVNRQNRAGKTFNEVEDLAELLGLGLYLISGPLGKELADVFDNIVHQLNEQKGKYYGKTAHYASFGAAELRFDPESVASEAKRERAIATLEGWLSSRAPWTAWVVGKFLDQLKDKILEQDERGEPPISPPGSPGEEASRWSEYRSALESQRQKMKEQALNRWEDLDLEAPLEEAFRDHNLPDLLQGLEEALNQVKKHIAQLQQEAKDADNRFKETVEQAGKAISQANNRPRGWFWQRSQAQEPYLTRKSIANLWNLATEAGIASARLELAERTKRQIAERKEKLENLRRRLQEELDKLLQQKEAPGEPGQRGQDRSPFILTLPPPYLEAKGGTAAKQVHRPSPGLRELLQDTQGTVQKLLEGSKVSLREWLAEVVRHRETDAALWEAVERTFRELDQLSSPAWDYEDAWVSNPGLGYREQVHIMGLEDASNRDHPLVGDEELINVFAGNLHDRMRLQGVSTGDPRRVLFYKVEASIPAFALRNIERYRERSERLRGERSFHVHRDWETTLPDLLPLPEREEAVAVWTKARLFGLLTKKDGQYCFPDHRRGKDQFFSLGSRPGEAFKALSQDFFAFKDLEAQVRTEEASRKASTEGIRGVLDNILRMKEDRHTKLESAAENWSEEDREVFRLELGVLEGLEKELAHYNPSHSEDNFIPV